jgi:hypothetical protein
VTVAVDGTRVLVTVGPRYRGAVPPVPPPPARVPAGTLLAAGRMEIAPLRAIVADWRAQWAKWQTTAAAAQTRADDDTDLLGDLPRIARALARLGERWEGWLWLDRGVHGLYRETGAPAIAPLGSEPIAALLPADSVAVDVDTRENLGERLSDAFSRIEDRLARRSLAETVRGEESGPAERAEAAYYKNFAKLRALVHDTGPSLFAGGSALVVGAGGRIGRLEIRDRPGASPRLVKNVAVPELAWVGRASDPKAALTFVSDVWAAFGGAAASALSGRAPVPQAGTLTDAPAPGPGVSARWFDTSWFDALAGQQVSADGGFKPQVAVRGDMFVLSTSPALAQRILALGAGAPANGRLALPQSKAPLIAWARYPCAPLVGQLRAALSALETVSARALNFGTAASPMTTRELGELGAGVCQFVDGATLTTVDEGTVRSTTFDLPAAAGLYRK